MSLDPLTGFDFDEAAGTMDRAAQKTADDHLYVQFFLHPVVDWMLTEGGELPKTHPRVKELRAREVERLDILRKADPFTEPPPDEPAEDAAESVKQLYELERGEYDLRRKAHDDELKDRASVLLDHPENPKLFVVAKQDHPVYTEKEFVRIIKPGDRDNILEVPLDADYKRRFHSRYEQWRRGVQGVGAVGTPLREVSFINSAQREEMAFFGIHTAEQLVNMSDSVAQHFMGIRALQQKVKMWLEATHGVAPAVEQLQAQVAARDAEMQALRQAIADLQSQLGHAGQVPSLPVTSDIATTVEKLAAESKGKRDRSTR